MMKNLVCIIFAVVASFCASGFGYAQAPAESPRDWVDVFDAQNRPLLDLAADIMAKTGVVIDVDPAINPVVSLYIENASLEDIVKIIADTQGLAYLVKLTPDGKKSFQILSLENYQQIQGTSYRPESISKAVTLRDVKPSEMLRHLEIVKSPDGKFLSYDSKNMLILMDRPEKVFDMLKRIEQIDVATETRTFEFANISPDELLPRLNMILSPYIGKAEMHQAASRVTVTDVPEKLAEIERLIDSLVNENRRIEIEVKVLEVVLSDEHYKGVDWSATVSNYKNMNLSRKSHGELLENFSVGTISSTDFETLIDALDTVGIVQEVSDAKFIVKNGTSADVPVKSVDLVLRPGDEDVADVERVEQRESIGFELSAFIDEEQNFLLQLLPQVSSIKERVWLDKFYTRSIPRDISHNKDEAISVVPDETLVVGGLFKNVIVKSTRRIPFLGKIPLLGFAFRNEGQETRKAEIILFLTPRLMQDE